MGIITNRQPVNDLAEMYKCSVEQIANTINKAYLATNSFGDVSDTGKLIDNIDEFQLRGLIDLVHFTLAGGMPTEDEAELLSVIYEQIELYADTNS